MSGEPGPANSVTALNGDSPGPAAGRAEGGEPEVAAPWQFSLWGMMVVMTMAAVAAAVAATRGVQSFVLSGGVTLTALNAAGFLRYWQTARWRPRWVGLGWLLFFVSLFLPSMQGCNTERLEGWEVAWVCGLAQFDSLEKLALEPESRQEFLDELAKPSVNPIVAQLFMLSINLANVTMMLVPLVWLAWRRDRARWVLGVLLVGATSACSLTWNPDADDLLYGYYVWCVAMMLVLASQRIPWKYAVAAWSLLAARLTLDLNL